jgi:imidazolonepropionase-like amidohydrolase
VKFLAKEKDLGTIDKGKLADLVLLEGKTTRQHQNTRRKFFELIDF